MLNDEDRTKYANESIKIIEMMKATYIEILCCLYSVDYKESLLINLE